MCNVGQIIGFNLREKSHGSLPKETSTRDLPNLNCSRICCSSLNPKTKWMETVLVRRGRQKYVWKEKGGGGKISPKRFPALVLMSNDLLEICHVIRMAITAAKYQRAVDHKEERDEDLQ